MRRRNIVFGFAALVIVAMALWACSSSPAPTPEPTKAPATATTAPAASPTKPAATPTVAVTPGATTSAGGNVEAGKAVFAANCNACHPNGEQGMGPDIKGKSADVVKSTVRQGKGAMPAFTSSQISDQQLNDLAAYVASLK